MTDVKYLLHRRFERIKQRCYNPRRENYPRYGGRGITICDEWLNDVSTFVEWALANGFQPNLQIDRIDNDGSYSPENCRWVTAQTNSRNRRNQTTNFEKGTRICSRCKVEKPLEEFSRHRGQPAGRHYVCKKCINEEQYERRHR